MSVLLGVLTSIEVIRLTRGIVDGGAGRGGCEAVELVLRGVRLRLDGWGHSPIAPLEAGAVVVAVARELLVLQSAR